MSKHSQKVLQRRWKELIQGGRVSAKRRWISRKTTLLLSVSGVLLAPTAAYAEGSAQVGLNQPLVETTAVASNRDLLVDITGAGEVINISGCGTAQGNSLRYIIESPTGAIVADFTTGTALTGTGKISCTNPMTAALTTAFKYTTTQTGRYKVRLINVTAANFNRFDVTVTSSTAVNPDPSGATGIIGRVSALEWRYSTGLFTLASATDANYYTLTPGGFPGTNYVWQLDLNQLAGNAYSITSNNLGVAAPRSGFSTPKALNSSTPLYQVYLNYPTIAGPPPSTAPTVTGFRFIDSAGQDYGISPGDTAGVQDSGFFEFSTNVSNSTYAIKIDVNANGIFGDAGDVTLTGNAASGFNSIPWNGRNNAGTALPYGTYQARAEVRLGEFHFIGDDIETSGGGASNGLTIHQALSQSFTVPTQVYWDDVTILGTTVPGGTSNTPAGTLSGRHTWGDFTAGGIGNEAFIDTYVFGTTTQASLFVAIVPNDNPLTGADGVVTITPTSVPGDTLALTVTDADLNSLPTIVETIIVSVRNDITGETEAVTLTETGPNTGIFSGSLATIFGASAGANNSGTMNSKNGDTITVTYDDALGSTGTAAVRTAQDVVSAAGATANLSITKDNGVTTVSSGNTLNYTVVVTNNGPDSATGAIVTDIIGAGLTCLATNTVTITGPGAPTGSFTIADLTGSGIALATLANGQTATLTYSCQVN
jgi:uncharacterized repeat protein (TIGR01451 family)